MAKLVLKKKIEFPPYVVELNRAVGDSIRSAQRYFIRNGIDADIINHKTTLKLYRPSGMAWADFSRIVKGSVQHRIGSVMMFSKHSGNTYTCQKRGNNANRFVKA